MGHIGKSKFAELQNKQMMSDMSRIEQVVPNDNICEACINGKRARIPLKKATDKTHVKHPLFIIHTESIHSYIVVLSLLQLLIIKTIL